LLMPQKKSHVVTRHNVTREYRTLARPHRFQIEVRQKNRQGELERYIIISGLFVHDKP